MYQGRRVTLQAFVPFEARLRAAPQLGCLPTQVAIESVLSATDKRKKRPKRAKHETHGQLRFTILRDDGEEDPSAF